MGVAGVTNRDLQQRGKKERGQWHSVSECYRHSHAHTHIHHTLFPLRLSLNVSVSGWLCVVCVYVVSPWWKEPVTILHLYDRR